MRIHCFGLNDVDQIAEKNRSERKEAREEKREKRRRKKNKIETKQKITHTHPESGCIVFIFILC